MIRLHAAARNERVGLAGQGVGGDQPHLADFVAAKRKADRVVALDEQARTAAERVPESRFSSSTGVGAEAKGIDGSEASAPNTPL